MNEAQWVAEATALLKKAGDTDAKHMAELLWFLSSDLSFISETPEQAVTNYLDMDKPIETPLIPLMDCPFCGGKASPNRDWQHIWVECDTCFARGQQVNRKDLPKAISLWNTRK